ncbi:MAG: dienelactone hydrolase family protein [Anaerolineales bacterium]|nr:dienelactone hydrolase family protein [Anaerolineales bacterium]
MQKRKLFLILMIISALGAGCSPGLDASAYRSQEPFEYYVYFPVDYKPDVNWLLFIGVHGEDESGEDCFRRWQPLADDNHFVLLCPTFDVADGQLVHGDSEQRIAAVLRNLYSAYPFQQQFFIAGLSAGGEFALQYAFHYPSAMTGVAALSAEQYPSADANVRELPILILVGQEDQSAVEGAQLFEESLQRQNLPVRVIMLDGEDEDLSSDASRLTVEFALQASRIIP